jgi:hypothetical protein
MASFQLYMEKNILYVPHEFFQAQADTKEEIQSVYTTHERIFTLVEFKPTAERYYLV